jgi:hypothetical protein
LQPLYTAKLHSNAIISGTNPHCEKIFAIIFFILFVLLFFIPRMIGEAFSEDLQSNQEAVPETPYIPL